MTPQQICHELDIAAQRAMFRRMARRRSSLCSVLRWAPVAGLGVALAWWVVR